MKKVVLLIIVLCILVVGCSPPGRNTEQGKRPSHGEVAGFPQGYFHGVAMPFSLLASAFDDDTNIYEVHNNGYPYNLGFFMGILLVYGGGTFSITRRKKK